MRAQDEAELVEVLGGDSHRMSRRAVAFTGSCVAAAVVALVAVGLTQAGRGSAGGMGPITPPSASPTPPSPTPSSPAPSRTAAPSTAVEPIDTRSWTAYKSDRYRSDLGPLVAHPRGWTVVPSTRDYRFATDVTARRSPAYESFVAPTGDVRVSVWEVPLDSVAAQSHCAHLTDRPFRMCVETVGHVKAWAVDHCEASGISTACAGIADRAVELCLEKWDCHPGVLVPFETAVQAYFGGGIYNADAMTVVTVWRGEAGPAVKRYGGAQRLLEAFLSTMEVWPASTPMSDRH